LSSIKTATDITKFLRESDLSLEKAEMKLKLADLVSSLADAKIQIVEVQEALQEKDMRIAELEEAFQSKDKILRYGDAYYNIDEKGKAIGSPFCLSCWEVDHKKRQLVRNAKSHHLRVCVACGHEYQGFRVPEFQPNESEDGS
jgi:hypothetical protein